MRSIRIIGPGRAGRSLGGALRDAGVMVPHVLGRADDVGQAASGVDAVVLAVPDGAIAEVAAAIEPNPEAAVLHCSGASGLGVLAPHERRGSLHPLVPLPDPEVGRLRLREAVWAVDGDPAAAAIVGLLHGRAVPVDPGHRVAYHAAAAIAANHVVALLGQVERVAALAGLTLEDFIGLARAAVEDVALLGPAAALTGPAARDDRATLDRHREILAEGLARGATTIADLDAYDVGVALARALVKPREVPSWR